MKDQTLQELIKVAEEAKNYYNEALRDVARYCANELKKILNRVVRFDTSDSDILIIVYDVEEGDISTVMHNAYAVMDDMAEWMEFSPTVRVVSHEDTVNHHPNFLK